MKEGTDFFGDLRNLASQIVHPDDLDQYLHALTTENILSGIRRNGIFALTHRIIFNGQPRYVQFRAAVVEEKAGIRLIAGINDAMYRCASRRNTESFSPRPRPRRLWMP